METVEKTMNEADNIIKLNYTGTLIHKWFKRDDIKQKYVQYAYKLWGMDFVYMIECENGNWNIKAIWDSWKAFWLCQINTRYHKLPNEYKTNWRVQVEYCYEKRSTWTRFYGPQRKIKGTSCANYVSNRFTIIE